MAKIILIWKIRDLCSSTKSHRKSLSALKVLNLSGSLITDGQTLGIEEIVLPKKNSVDSDTFLAEYRDLIGELSSSFHTHWWWATNIASKNRFTSRISFLLQQVEACSLALKLVPDDLIIYGVDLSLITVLEELAAQSGRKLSYPAHYLRWSLLWNRLRALLGHGKSMVGVMYHMFLAHFLGKSVKFDRANRNLTVLKTFFYQSSIDEKDGFCYRDPMFGRLPEFLASRGDLIILTQILDDYRACIKQINQQHELSIVPVEKWLSLIDVIRCFFILLILRLDKKVPKQLMFRGINVSGLFRQELFRKYNDIPFDQMLYYSLMKTLVKTHPAKHYIQTYENNPWEKMAIAALREVSPATVITGYQQSVVPQASVNVFNSIVENKAMPLPDRVLCVGQEPLEILNMYNAEGFTRAEAGCGLRYEYLQDAPGKPRKNIERILIAPEGVEQVLPMLRYVVRELEGLSQYQMTFRFHPSLPYRAMMERGLFDIGGIENAVLSEASLQDDLAQHDVCIYWGSTVSLEALSIGLPLIHFDVGSRLSFDPLFRCSHLKWMATDRTPLADLFNLIDALGNAEYDFQARQAKAYLKKYFFPVSEQSLKKFIMD